MILSLKNFTASPPAKERKKRVAPHFARTDSDFDPRLLDLVRLRVAQLHECNWCAQEQIKKLKARGEIGARLLLLKDWRQEPVFSDREEAALNLTEALTRNPVDSIPGDVVHAAFLFFKESEMVSLIVAVLAENDWYYLKGLRTAT